MQLWYTSVSMIEAWNSYSLHRFLVTTTMQLQQKVVWDLYECTMSWSFVIGSHSHYIEHAAHLYNTCMSSYRSHKAVVNTALGSYPESLPCIRSGLRSDVRTCRAVSTHQPPNLLHFYRLRALWTRVHDEENQPIKFCVHCH